VHDVFAKTGAIVHAENAADSAGGGADCAPNYRAERASIAATLLCAILSPAHGALRLRCHWESQDSHHYH
jgi:hypothetical protein